MIQLLQIVAGSIAGKGPFAEALAVVSFIFILAAVFRDSLTKQRAKTLNDVQTDYDTERKRRIEADVDRDRWRERAEFFRSRARDARHDRMGDRQAHVLYEENHGIDPLLLPDIAVVPLLVKEDGE